MHRTKPPKKKLVKTKHKLVRTEKKEETVFIKYVRPGTRIFLPYSKQYGYLIHANDCRAHVEIGSKRVDISPYTQVIIRKGT